jgi:hypothetical protein
MIRFIMLFSCMLWFGTHDKVHAQRIDFYMEDLNFYLDTNSFEVDGYYYLSNSDTAKTRQLIFYPYPQESGLGIVDTVRVYDEMEKKELLVTPAKDNSGVSFPLTIEGMGFRKIRIFYRQRLEGDHAVYILKTTQNWGKPLSTAVYTLTSPGYIKINALSYPPDSVKPGNDKNVYYWNKKDFFPSEDFRVQFSR